MAPTEDQFTVWRGDNPGFQTQAVGNYPDKSDTADKDNIYLSDQGWAYRHYKNKEKTKYWDEIIWAGFVSADVNDNLPVGIFGAESQTFLTGDGFRFASGPYPLVVSTIGTVTIKDGGQEVSVGDADVFNATNDGSFSGTKTYLWKVFEGSTDVTSNTNKVTSISGATAQSATITFAAPGSYTVRCTVGDQAGQQASVDGSMIVVVVAADATHTIGTVTVVGPQTAILNDTYQWTTTYSGNAPVGDVDVVLTAAGSGSNSAFEASNVQVSKDADTNKIVVSSVFNQAAYPGATATVTSTASDPTANPTSATGTTTVDLKGVIGVVTATLAGNAAGASVAQGTASTACASSVTSGAIGTFGANGAAATTFKWDVKDPSGGTTDKVTFGNATLATTTFGVAADAPVGTYTISVEYTNADALPTIVKDEVTLTVTAS